MQDASFAEPAERIREAALPPATRVAMLLLGYVPLLHVVSVIAVFFLPMTMGARATLAVVVVYLAPPLLARVVGVREGTFGPGEGAFLRWWLSNQLQVLFNRLPLEELLRIVPGLYSLWLRLWGARIGSLVYWSPRVLPLDRGLLRIGNRVVIGAGVRLAGHVLTRTPEGQLQLTVAPVTIGDETVIGGWALIAPGVSIGAAESVPPAIGIPPHTTWSGGRRRRTKENAL